MKRHQRNSMTEQQYNTELKLLRASHPTHAILETLSEGYNKWNVIYLKHVLKKIITPKVIEKTVEEVEVKTIVEVNEKVVVSSPLLAKLKIGQSNLFAARATLSNKLHTIPYTPNFDAQRAEIMDEIKIVQREIAQNMSDIDCVKRNGILPNVKAEFEIPKDGAERERKKNNLRASISHKRAFINELIGDSDIKINENWIFQRIEIYLEDIQNVALRENLLKSFKKLLELKKHLDYVEDAIKADTVHAS